MDLQLLFSVLLKHRRLIMVGVALGIVVLALTSYKVSFKYQGNNDWPLFISPRTDSSYETSISLAIDSPKFGLGRAGLAPESWPAFGRTIDLAPTYAYIVESEFMRKRVEAGVGKLTNDEQITSELVENTPIFKVWISGTDSQRVEDIAFATLKELRNYIEEMQKIEKTPENDRITIREIGPPTEPVEVDRLHSVKLALAFLSPILLAMAMAFLIENIERSPAKRRAGVNVEESH